MKKAILLSSIVALTLGTSTVRAEEEHPMLESYNRAMFSFNNYFNHYLLMPAARGYRAVTTKPIRTSIRSSLSNLREPLTAGNHALQGNLKDTGVSIARFAINSTLGLFGLFDVASGWGLEKNTTNFDDTFAEWCIPDGPYIVLPFLGPSTPRDAVGTGLGFVLDPVYWATYNDKNISDKVAYSYAALQAISLMEENMDMLNDFEKNSVDFYSTVKSAFMQHRKNKGCFAKEATEDSPADYDFDFNMDEY